MKMKMKMKWWEQMKMNMLPLALRRVWLSVSSRLTLKPRTHEDGLLKLHNDVQTCEYQDVQIMWEILQKSETEQIANEHHHKHPPFWRVFLWSNHS